MSSAGSRSRARRWSYNLSFHWRHVPLVMVHQDAELIWGWHSGEFAVILMRYRL